MDSYPKRLDLWFVYVDMEIKQNNVAGVRALLNRILVQRLSSSAFLLPPPPSSASLTPRSLAEKGKSVFKKWLSFEKEHGDEAGVDACKTKALAFVESLA